MPRVLRGLADNHIYHVINRGNGQQRIFKFDEDFAEFIELIGKAFERYQVQVLAYCILPDHFHLLLRPRLAKDLSRWMQWLMTSHVRAFHRKHGSCGHVWQGRYKSFLVKDDEHLLTVFRFVEGNPVRLGFVSSALDWRWSSHGERVAAKGSRRIISDCPIALPDDWTNYVNQSLTEKELQRLSQSVRRQTPFGDREWQMEVCEKYGLESTIRKRGRPKKG